MNLAEIFLLHTVGHIRSYHTAAFYVQFNRSNVVTENIRRQTFHGASGTGDQFESVVVKMKKNSESRQI